MNTSFIELTFGNYIIVHGYDKRNKEIAEEIKVETPTKKIISIDRIKSVSKKYILTDYLDGRSIYWEYEEEYDYVKNQILK